MSETAAQSPRQVLVASLRSAWNTALTVYYANSLAWRGLKAGALFFLGFFVWAGSNVLRSYFPGVGVLDYTTSYGFVLIGYGPFHHLVVIPVYQRLRRAGTHLSLGHHVTLPNVSLAVFLVLVLALGAASPGVVALDFQSSLGDGGPDIDPDLACVRDGPADGATVVHCHLTDSEGVDRVVVTSGGRTLVTDDDPPYEFSVRADELRSVNGQKRFRVSLYAPDGTLARRYTRSLSMIDEA